MSQLEEWIECRKEVQNFTRLLSTYRIIGFLGYFLVIAAGIYLNLFTPVVIGMGIVFITFMCTLDNKLSCYKDAVSGRANELEHGFSGTPLSERMKHTKKALPFFHKYCVYILYTSLIAFGFLIMWLNMMIRKSPYMQTFYTILALYVIVYLVLLWESETIRRKVK